VIAASTKFIKLWNFTLIAFVRSIDKPTLNKDNDFDDTYIECF
jgi:hypothetical protein